MRVVATLGEATEPSGASAEESGVSSQELESEVGGESEDQRPESRLAPESTFAGPA